MRRGDAMAHQNSVLHQLVQLIPWDAFNRLVGQYGADDSQRGFTSRDHLVAMLYAQLAGIGGLRELVAALQSQEAALYHLGVAPVPRSTLSDANRDRPGELFIALFMVLNASLTRGQRRAMAGTIFLIDASVLPLIVRHSAWARFSATACGAKMHVVYAAAAACPVYAAVSAANVNDITAARAMPIEPGATYVFDLGYYDYAWQAGMRPAAASSRGSRATRRCSRPRRGHCRRAAPSCPTASVICRHGRRRTGATRCGPACARCRSASPPARCCGSSATTSRPLPRRSPTSTSFVGASSYSSSGSSRRCGSRSSSAGRRTRWPSRSPPR